jgi:nicotinamidase-related amidase
MIARRLGTVLLIAAFALAGCAPRAAVVASSSKKAARAATASRPGPTLRELYAIPRVERLDPRRTALVLVDFQEEFFHGKLVVPGADDAAARARELLAWVRSSGIAAVHVQNVARPGSVVFAPGSPTIAFTPALAPRADELVVTKPTGGAFTKTDLDAKLRARGIDTIVVAGIMAHLAVAMTAQDGAVLGYRVVVASDATTTRDLPGAAGAPEVDHVTLARAALAALADRFADVLPTTEIVALPLVHPS